jgi:TetR/AcrR family transcriptional regulator, cholesterol catabolism regulator
MTEDAVRFPQAETAASAKRRSRADARRGHITSVAVKLIHERGYEGLSVNDLAEAAGMSVGGMYRYIKTKSDVLLMASEDIYGGLREEMVEAAAKHVSVEESLRAALEIYLESVWESRDRVLLMYREYRHLPGEARERFMAREMALVNVFGDLIRQGIAQGVFPSTDPSLVAHDMVLLGHLPALKGWALRDRDRADTLRKQRDAILGLVTGARGILDDKQAHIRRLPNRSRS